MKLLVERSSLITECDSMTAALKKFELKTAELQQLLAKKGDLSRLLEEERDNARSEVDAVRLEVAAAQSEALKSYEDGYHDCWGRFASGPNVDPAKNTFEEFLLDLRVKENRDEAGSSNLDNEANV